MAGWIYTENGFWELEAGKKHILKACARAGKRGRKAGGHTHGQAGIPGRGKTGS